MYRVVDKTKNQLLMKTGDFKSILKFLIDIVPYDRKKHYLTKNNEPIKFSQLLKLKIETEKVTGRTLYPQEKERKVYTPVSYTNLTLPTSFLV